MKFYINNWRSKMFLSNDEIIKVMLEYIEEDKYKSAILINGEWGSGKTFFITEKLSKVIKDKIKNDNKINFLIIILLTPYFYF